MDNGVDEMIQSLPSNFQLVNTNAKSRRRLQFNTRSTIPWKLECEQKGLDREYGIQSFSFAVGQDKDLIESIDKIAPTAYFLLGGFTFGTCCCGFASIICEGSFHGTFIAVITSICLRIAAIVMASMIMSYLTSVSDITDNNLLVLEEA